MHKKKLIIEFNIKIYFINFLKKKKKKKKKKKYMQKTEKN